MADPVSAGMGLVGIGATALGGATAVKGAGIAAAGARYQGEANSAMYTYQAGVAQANAELARRQSAYSLERGEVEAQQIGLRGRAQIADIIVGATAGNISRFGASTRAVAASAQTITQYEEGMSRYNAIRQAYGFDVTAAMDVAQAGAYRSAAATAPIAAEYQAQAAELSGQASMLGSVASVATQFAKGTQTGLFSLGA